MQLSWGTFGWGSRFDQNKLQRSASRCSRSNLRSCQRKEELIKQVDSILQSDVLDPCTAGKLPSSWGMSEESCGVLCPRSSTVRSEPSSSPLSLEQWRMLVISGLPSPIEPKLFCIVDVVIFTEGFTADIRKRDGWTGSAEW